MARNLFANPGINVGFADQLRWPVRINGHALTDEDFTRLGFACRGGQLYLRQASVKIGDRSTRTLCIEGDHPRYYQTTTRIHLLKLSGEVVVFGQEFALHPDCRRQGYSRFALALQLRAAALIGIKTIIAEAHGDNQNQADFQGYTAWPRLGFDGVIPAEIWDGLPEDERIACGFPQQEPILLSKLLNSGERGTRLWADHGKGFTLTLSTDPRSPAAANMINLLRRSRL